MANFVVSILLMSIEWWMKKTKASEEAWKSYIFFISKTKYWSEMPAKKQSKYRARMEEINIRWQEVFGEKMEEK